MTHPSFRWLTAAALAVFSSALPPPASPAQKSSPARISSPLLETVAQQLGARGWTVNSNPPSYEFPVTDGHGNTYFFHGLSLHRQDNSAMRHSLAKIDVNSARIAEETAVRNALPSPLNLSFQFVYLTGAAAVSSADVETLETLLRSGGLTEERPSTTTALRPATWTAIKGLYQ